MMTMNGKPPPRPTSRRVPPPDQPALVMEETAPLSQSLGTGASLFRMPNMPLHRQLSEAPSISHAGYLFKRSNRPHDQQVSPLLFPLDNLEITLPTNGTARSNQYNHGSSSTLLYPQQHLVNGVDDFLATPLNAIPDSTTTSNGGYSKKHRQHQAQQQQQQQQHQQIQSTVSQNRPLHLPYSDDDPNTPLVSKFDQIHEDEIMVPMQRLAPDYAESISTRGTTDIIEDFGSSPGTSREASPALTAKRKVAIEESLNSTAAFFGINLESSFQPIRRPSPEQPVRMVSASPVSGPGRTLLGISSRTTSSRDDDDSTNNGNAQQLATERASFNPVVTSSITPTKSVPIKVQTNNPNAFSMTIADSDSANVQHRRSSAPYASYDNVTPSVGEEMSPPTTFSPCRSRPADYIDRKDYHLWRAKYCVLEEGVLYFYRTKEDADSQDAKHERKTSLSMFDNKSNGTTPSSNGDPFDRRPQTITTKRTEVADLSKSPMPSRSVLVFPNVGGISPSASKGSSSGAESTFMWEKRVPLSCVGAVRSAETEYGKNAFELLAVDDNEGEGCTNKLVLKAPKQGEMNEWIFQFHRSLASFVMNVVDLVGGTRSPGYTVGDIHHPRFDQNGFGAQSLHAPLRSFNLPNFSPRFVPNMPNQPAASLSHGHGRNQFRRRRGDLNGTGLSSDGSVHSVPNTTARSKSPTTLSFALSYLPPTSNLVTPLKQRNSQVITDSEAQRLHQQKQEEISNRSPELSAPPSANPETERPPAPTGGKYVPPHLRQGSGKYVPPHLRNKADAVNDAKPAAQKYIPPHLRGRDGSGDGEKSEKVMAANTVSPNEMGNVEPSAEARDAAVQTDTARQEDFLFRLGGCADPFVIAGSILDQQYVAKKASSVGRVPTEAHGSIGGRQEACNTIDAFSSSNDYYLSLEWEIGAVSECGIRDSNEDAYFVTNDLVGTFTGIVPGTPARTYWDGESEHKSGLFAIFDGHCGNEAARFAAERLPHFLYTKSLNNDAEIAPALTQEIMRQAMESLDEEFCRICVEDGREWESGSTALVAMLANEHLVIASIGDCRGVLCRTFAREESQYLSDLIGDEWRELVADDDSTNGPRCFWREVADVHSPSREDEKNRIEKAGGWTTTETEIPISQLQRMDFLDKDVVDILRRCFQDRINDHNGSKACSSAPQRILQIHRVCGELAVSRAIGDRDFKAACNMPQSADLESDAWETSLFLSYPEDHDRRFVGDLVSGKPDFQSIRVGEKGTQGEFLVLACDGLWDVMDMDDAVRVTQDLLFNKKCPAKQAAARLAELAVHLGSSDNITVIVIRIFAKGQTRREHDDK